MTVACPAAAPLWTLAAAAQAVGATGVVGGAETALTSLSIDTRSLDPGALFVALEATRDGHDFVPQAFERGAAAALVHRRADRWPAHWPLIEVADTQAGLEALGAAARDRSPALRIGITGSVGKTTTKEALAQVLRAQGRTHAATGSFNNHWGVPLTLARMPAATDYGVFELGMNHAGELAALSPQVRPHVAVVTMVAPVHLEFFASTDDIARAKAEIFAGIAPGGTAVWNADLPQSPLLEAAAKASPAAHHIALGRGEGCGARLLGAEPLATGGCRLAVDLMGQRLEGTIALPANPHAHTALVVLTLAALAGADPVQALVDLGQVQPVKGRGQTKTLRLPGHGSFTLIDESYNASPPAVSAALAHLASHPAAGRRIAVLGDMLELGHQGPAIHAGLARHILGSGIDSVHTVGPLMAHLSESLPSHQVAGHHPDSGAAATAVASQVGDGDIVMVKGSAGMKMGTIIAALEALTPDPLPAD